MILNIMNREFDTIAAVDTFRSFIWTQRYNAYGDFELYVPVNTRNLDIFKLDYYIIIKDSEAVMIIEKISIENDVENGQILYISGRSLESILGRRVLYSKYYNTSQQIEYFINYVLNTNVANTNDTNRNIKNFNKSYHTHIQNITNKYIDIEYRIGDNIYDIIHEVCSDNDIGFKIILNDNLQFVFYLYIGIDRSYKQFVNPYVIFSNKYDNLLNSQYVQNVLDYKNIIHVYSDEPSSNGRYQDDLYLNDKIVKDLDRREMFYDASSISTKDDDDEYIPYSQYQKTVKDTALKELKPYTKIKAFEGEIDSEISFKYGEDFFLGDIIQIEDEWGNEARARITEITWSQDENGYRVYPTFTILEEEE